MSDSTKHDLGIACLLLAGAFIIDMMWRHWCKMAARKLRAQKNDKPNPR